MWEHWIIFLKSNIDIMIHSANKNTAYMFVRISTTKMKQHLLGIQSRGFDSPAHCSDVGDMFTINLMKIHRINQTSRWSHIEILHKMNGKRLKKSTKTEEYTWGMKTLFNNEEKLWEEWDKFLITILMRNIRGKQ